MIKIKKLFPFFALLVFLFVTLAVFSVPSETVLASGDSFGVETVDETIVLKSDNPIKMVVRIINITLSILGIISVVIILFAGFLWMTSEGNEEKIDKAKRILKNAVIGLIIILSAWGIVTFIFRNLFDDSGMGGSIPSNNSSHFQTGLGAIGVCTVESVYPEPGQKNVPRNTIIMVTFKEEVRPETINADNVSICLENDFDFNSRVCSNPASFSSATNDNKIFVLSPDSYLGNENSNTSYLVYFSNDVLKLDEDVSIFSTCSPQYLLWNFEVSNKLDLTPPQIESVFPQPDDGMDLSQTVSEASVAGASISVTGVPRYFTPARIVSVTNGGGTSSSATSTINQNYTGQYTNFQVTVSDNKAFLSSVSPDIALGAFDLVNNRVDFPNYFYFEVEDDWSDGNSWTVVVEKMIPADKIKVGSYEYTFVNGESDLNGYRIGVRTNQIAQAEQIALVINSNPLVSAENFGSAVNFESLIGGSGGNSIVLEENSSAIEIVYQFSGGADKIVNNTIVDKKDKPMNSIIQINFNEAVNPLTVAGKSDEVSDYIRVINRSDGDSIVSGTFKISSNYKTVEFISDFKCGTNACGVDIFCLPAESNIAVEIEAASLFDCGTSDLECSTKNPFTNCIANICQNDDGKRYPLARSPINGVVDTANNSLDGNKDGYSYGPATYHNLNNPSLLQGDSVVWSFYTSSYLETEPPLILEYTPEFDLDKRINMFAPVEIIFDRLMSASTLTTGKYLSKIGDSEVYHDRLNIKSGQPVGYWVSFENQDVNPPDGDPDRTRVFLEHAKFFEGASYSAQAGSGLNSIYQNCFKPSASIDCNADINNPSCCNLSPTENSTCN
ncbi:MAG: Ig-like domain-containing protein [Patescibacteria group bacterium]